MGQQLSHVNEKLLSMVNNDSTPLTSDAIIAGNGKDDILTLLNVRNPLESDRSKTIPILDRLHTKQIQTHLFQLTNSVEHKAINLEIYDILFENVFKKDLARRFRNTISEVEAILNLQQKLQTALMKKIQEEKNTNQSIFNKDKAEREAQQLSYFAIQSLTSILLILIKSAEKHDPTIVQQILTLASQLCEQMPMKCLSFVTNGIFLAKSLKPLTTYISDLLLQEDPSIKKQVTKILLCFGIAKDSLKDILPIVSKLIFQMDNVYDARGLLIQLNNGLADTMDELETKKKSTANQTKDNTDSVCKQPDEHMISIPLDYLKSIQVFPTAQLMELDEEKFTGHFLASVILAHIDFEHAVHSGEQFNNSSVNSSLFFEFHHDTFQQLFHLIKQLAAVCVEQSSPTVDYMLTVCLRLFTTHLTFLCAIKSTIDRDILITNNIIKDNLKSSPLSQENLDLTRFATDTELEEWFELLLKLAYLSNQNSRNIAIFKEASKGLLFLFDKKKSFTDKLSFIHRVIIENRHPVLIEYLWLELSKTITLLSWIEALSHEDYRSEDGPALTILYSFIDMYLNPPAHFTDENKQRTKDMLHMFQELLLLRLGLAFEKKSEHPLITNNDTTKEHRLTILTASSVVVKYLVRMLNSCIENEQVIRDIFNDILVGLYLMTEKEAGLAFLSVEPIFVKLLPLLGNYIIWNRTKDDHAKTHLHCLSWLLGRMSSLLIAGPPKDALETKHANRLDSLLFMNGCEPMVIEKSQYLMDLFQSDLAVYSHFKWNQQQRQSSSDDEFLMSVYHNQDQGAKLVSKMKIHLKNKQRFLQKSIEQFVNDACAALFAVYIKHYRQIHLAKSELFRSDHDKPHDKLLSIYEYANRVQMIFIKTKAQGGDCDNLFKQIKNNALFLLLSVKENSLIPIVNENLSSAESNTPSLVSVEQNRMSRFKRQESRWTKAKNIIRLLRNSMRACIRLKRLMISKKQSIEQEYDPESVLNRLIDGYVYADMYENTISIENEDKKRESNQLIQCLYRQYERAMTRLITYRFIETFISKVFSIDDHNRALSTLAIYLPHMRYIDLVEWTYVENIQASNSELKDAVANSYYSCIHMILSHILQSTRTAESTILIPSMFHLLNLSYRSIDVCYLDRYQLIQTLCKFYVNFIEKSDPLLSLKSKLSGYTWFRLFVYKLCDIIREEQAHGMANPLLCQQRDFVFQSIIFGQLKELKRLKQTLSTAVEEPIVDSNEGKDDALGNTTIEWFIKQVTTVNDDTSTILDIQLCINQFLILLLRCVHLYEHVRSFCAKVEFVEELLDIYHHSQHQSGYIQPYGLGSIVRIYAEDEDIDEFELAIITEINTNARDQDTSNILPYFVHYSQSDKSEWISADKLYIYIDVLPPNLLSMYNENDSMVTFHAVLDTIGYLLQINTSTTTSLTLVQLKRYAVMVFHQLLNNRNLIEVFMQKPYATVIAQLALGSKHLLPNNLRLFNRQHLEQYCLSLDRYIQSKTIVENENDDSEIFQDALSTPDTEDSSYVIWNAMGINRDQSIIDALSTSTVKYGGWKANASETEIGLYKQGRIGSDDISIVSIPRQVAKVQVLEECGNKHRFHGRINGKSRYIQGTFPTFTFENLEFNEGKWYYCVKLPVGGLVQIGWATAGFKPETNDGLGVGDDIYSWCYDGSRSVLFHNNGYNFPSEDLLWKENDVCGCGIEIDGENTRIKYWLNGKFLGTAFSHESDPGLSRLKCNMIPHGCNTTYFPCVSLETSYYYIHHCELIISPEDMDDCPLPPGYKPLLTPKLIHVENSIVAYPYSAYLIGNDTQDYLHTSSEINNSISLLRDFVSDDHLETTFMLDDQWLIIPENSGGLSIPLNTHESSLTISFDLKTASTTSDETSPSIHSEKLENLIMFANLDTDEDLTAIGELMLNCWQDLQKPTSTSDIIEIENDNKEGMA
ncbi:unnamed protein product [Rotaria sp. Silwood1]|nr:unnamed protein product [Rotaria sp. Silwood1]